MQKVLNNPLASPSTLGVSNGAVFGANCAILLFGAGSVKGAVNGSLTVSNPYTVTICAFAAAFLGIAVNLVLAAKKRFSSETVVLCGVAVGAFFTAGTTVLQYFSADSQLSSAVFWSFGDLGRASFRECVFMSAVIVPAVVFTAIRSRDIDLLEQGGETALSLGVNVTLGVLCMNVNFIIADMRGLCVFYRNNRFYRTHCPAGCKKDCRRQNEHSSSGFGALRYDTASFVGHSCQKCDKRSVTACRRSDFPFRRTCFSLAAA